MVSLLLAILCSVLLGFIFKLFERYGVHAFQAIVVNYFTCVACGWWHAGVLPFGSAERSAPWMPYALMLGLVFISGFNAAAQTVRYFGVTVSQVMQKMSILLTVPFAIWVYRESSSAAKWMGFVLALAAIVLVNWRKEPARTSALMGMGLLWIPLLTWVLSGVIEMVLVTVQHERLTDTNSPIFITTVFGTAGLLGLAVAVVGLALDRLRFSWRNVVGGLVLGVPNYASMWFLLRALDSGLEASVAFPLMNIGIILTTTFGAVWLFDERLSGLQRWGIALAVAAIALIST
ncbi:MAG: hypothetical protein RMJ33_03460 [Saprospiraceae bacterium]|nr:hypothetical protein [Saprospiraceae bacterium]MDW8228876.1 hypothetical protein [Saprospiraceae bacterium]